MKWVFMSLVSLNLLVMTIFWRDINTVSSYEVVEPITLPGNKIMLVSEAVTKNKDNSIVQTIADNECYVLGPFKDTVDAKFISVRADTLGYSSVMRSMTTGVDYDSWVYIPSLLDRQKSLGLIKELKGRGVDSYLITQGELAEGISLGLFQNKESAASLSEKMTKLGYNVKVKRVDRGTKAIWIEFMQVDELTDSIRSRITGAEKELTWKLIDCQK